MRFRLFILFMLASLFASGSFHFLVKKESSVLKTIPIDTTKGLIIQNSGPKGNGSLDATGRYGYIDPAGKTFGYIIFWTRLINETVTPLELTINFPADSFAIFGQPRAYVKLFLPPDTMTLEKESLIDYGLTGLKSFLDTSFHKPTKLQRTINPKEEFLFYTVEIADGYNGVARAGLVLKDQNLFYKTNMLDSLIPCGHIVFKK